MASRTPRSALPDIVAGGLPSLDLSLRWMRIVLEECQRALLPVQDGMEPAHVADLIGERVGIFIGGSTAWKLSTMATWAELARQKNAWCHVGRVNSKKRIAICQRAGVTSFDGSGASKFTKVKLPVLDAQVRQRTFDFGGS